MASTDRPSPDPQRGRDKRAPGHQPAPVDLTEESVAGEEDPGAALDVGDLTRERQPGQGQPGKRPG